MAVLNLPLPGQAGAPPGGFFGGAEAVNQLHRSNLENQIKEAQAQYAPYTSYADAASKIAYANMLPYQIRATLLSNPMLWQLTKEHPEVMKGMTQELMQSMPNNIFGNLQLPMPNQGGMSLGNGGLIGGLINYLTQNKQIQPSTNALVTNNLPNPNIAENNKPMVDNSSNVSPNMTSTGLTASVDPLKQIQQQQTTKFGQLPYATDKPLTTETGEKISPTTPSTISQVQQSYLSLQNVVPILDDIADRGEKLLSSGQMKNINIGSIVNTLDQWGAKPPDWLLKNLSKNFNIDYKSIDEFAKWNADRKQAVEGLMNALSLPGNIPSLQDVHGIIDPMSGESGKAYADRIRKEKDFLLNKRLPQYKKLLGEGVPLNNEIVTKNIIPTNFKSKKEFQDWFKSQDKQTQNVVINQLRSK